MTTHARPLAATLTLTIAALAALIDTTDAHARGNAVLTPASEIQWNDVPGFPGVQLAAVGGNPGKGPHHSMLKFVGGFEAPVHHHTTDHYGTVVAERWC